MRYFAWSWLLLRKAIAILVLASSFIIADHKPDVIITEDEEWLLAITAPVIAKLESSPILMAIANPIDNREVELLQHLAPQKVMMLTTEKNSSPSWLKDSPVEFLRVAAEPMRASISLVCKFWKQSDDVVIAHIRDFEAVIQGASLAAHMRVPLILLNELASEQQQAVTTALKDLQCKRLLLAIYSNTSLPAWFRSFPHSKRLLTRHVLRQTIIEKIGETNVHNIILTRIFRTTESTLGNSAWITPYLSLVRKAPIVFCTRKNARQAQKIVYDFSKNRQITPRTLTIIGDYDAIGTIAVKDKVTLGNYRVEVEPCAAPQADNAFALGVGRIPLNNLWDAALFISRTIARERAIVPMTNVVMVANPLYGDLPLAETIARATAKEFKNFSVPIQEFYQRAPDDDEMTATLSQANFIIYQGHIAGQYLFPSSREEEGEERNYPTRLFGMPLVVLQSCSSLEKRVSQYIFDTGGVGVIGTVTKVHSASGSSFIKAFGDGILYRGSTVGEALRDARNFYLCLAKLKTSRGHKEMAKCNRVALSFRLWGDPEMKLFPQLLERPKKRSVKAKFTPKNNIRISTPKYHLSKTKTEKYFTKVFAGDQLAGVVKSLKKSKKNRRVMPMYFFRLSVPQGFNAKDYKTLLRKRDNNLRAVFMSDDANRYVYILYLPQDKPKKGKQKQYLLKFQQ